MYRKGDKVVVYGGTTGSKGSHTTVELAIVEAVGEHQLVVRPCASWGRPAVVHISRCEPIRNKFKIPPLVPLAKIGDLVLVWSWKYGDSEIETQVGTVHSIIHKVDGVYFEVHIGTEIVQIEKDNCIILQSSSKKS